MTKSDALNWLNKMIECPGNYRIYYSDEEQIELAKFLLFLLDDVSYPQERNNEFYCSNCDCKIEVYHKYCPYCGKKLNWKWI